MKSKKRSYFIFGLLGIVLLMVIGFAGFSQSLQIGDVSGSNTEWNIYIKDVETTDTFGNVTGSGKVVDKLAAEFKTTLHSPGDYVTYTITVANDGNVDAVLDFIDFYWTNDDSVITYSSDGIEMGDKLLAMSEMSFTITVQYDPAMTGTALDHQKENTLNCELYYIEDTGDFVYEESSNGDWALVLDNSENDGEDIYPLVFVRTDVSETISVGDTYVSDKYGELIVKSAYTGFELNSNTPWDGEVDTVTSVSFEDEFNLSSAANYFASLNNLKKVDLTNVNFSNLNDMTAMFQNAAALEEVIFPEDIDTSNVYSFANLFDGCLSLKSVDLSGFDTSNAIDMFSMFRDCAILETIDISTFNTANVYDMGQMFSNNISLKSIIFGENWNTASATIMENMFYNDNLLTLDCSGWNVDNVTDHGRFNESDNGTITTIKAPIWKN